MRLHNRRAKCTRRHWNSLHWHHLLAQLDLVEDDLPDEVELCSSVGHSGSGQSRTRHAQRPTCRIRRPALSFVIIYHNGYMDQPQTRRGKIPMAKMEYVFRLVI